MVTLASLSCAAPAAAILHLLQSHYSSTVAPAVSGSVAELSAASSALLALIRAAEDSITAVLRKSVDTFMTQVSLQHGSTRLFCAAG
jgi:hypothetical protein